MIGVVLIGIDFCLIEGFSYFEVNCILVEEGLFDLNEWGVFCMVIFGYCVKEIKKKYCKFIEEVIEWVE